VKYLRCLLSLCLAAGLLAGCNNNPSPAGAASGNTLFTAAIESSPKHLNPTSPPVVRFQPHPAFALNEQSRHRYHGLAARPLGRRARAAGLRTPGHARSGG